MRAPRSQALGHCLLNCPVGYVDELSDRSYQGGARLELYWLAFFVSGVAVDGVSGIRLKGSGVYSAADTTSCNETGHTACLSLSNPSSRLGVQRVEGTSPVGGSRRRKSMEGIQSGRLVLT
jgi:hypothetical protein